MTSLGVVGQLMVWEGAAALNLSNDRLYVLGIGEDEVGQRELLYTVDSTSGEVLNVLPVSSYTPAVLLVH